MQGRDSSIERFTAYMTLMMIGEDEVFDKKLLDRGTTLREIVLPEYFQQIALQKHFDGG
jgi:hypothetical protein